MTVRPAQGIFGAYPIGVLIDTRGREFGFSRAELATRCGYANVATGLRAIDGLCAGDLTSMRAKYVIAMLPAALLADADTVRAALLGTSRPLRDRTP